MKLRADYEHGSVFINGKEYYFQNHVCDVPNHVGNFLLSRGDYTVGLNEHVPLRSAKRILFVRGAGLGDVMMCVPIVNYIKRNINQNAKIDWLCGTGEFIPVLNGIKCVEQIYSDKTLPGDVSSRYNNIASLDYAEFKSNESFTRHRIDVFAHKIPELKKATIKPKSLEYHITEEEKLWPEQRGIQKPYVTMTTTTTCFNRVLTRKMNEDICKEVQKLGYKVVMIDKDRVADLAPGVYNLTGKLNLRQVGALLYNADIVITPDTGIFHMASALDKPMLAYFGAIDASLRVTSKMTKVITFPVDCYPCNVYVCHRGKPECVQNLSIEYIMENFMAVRAFR
jgi:ADP-heptose:LPS heptosyltransferase